MTDLVCPIFHSTDPERPRRPAPGSLLCTGHIEQGRSVLRELPGLDDQLAVIAAPTGIRASGSRSADKPIPYHEKAAQHRAAIRTTLTTWARIVLGARDLTFTGEDTIAGICEFLGRHHDWSVGQPWADEYANELRGLRARARSLLGKRPPGEATRVPCPAEDCDGMLIAPFRDAELLNRDDIDSVKLQCRECGWYVPVIEWLDLALAEGMTKVLAVDVAVVVLANSLGAQVNSAATVRSWAHRGHIQRYEQADGSTLYDLLQVREWLTSRKDAA